MDNYKFELHYNGSIQEIEPFGALTLSHEKADNTEYFNRVLSSFKVKDGGYTFIKNIENTGNTCSNIDVIVYNKCNGSWSEYYKGVFTIVNCEFNDKDCIIEINQDPNTEYTCLSKILDVSVNLITETFPLGDEWVDYQYPDIYNTHLSQDIFIYNSPSSSKQQELSVIFQETEPSPSTLTFVGSEIERENIKIQRFEIDPPFEYPTIGGFDPNPIKHYVAWNYRKIFPISFKVNGVYPESLKGGWRLLDGTLGIYVRKPDDNDNLIINYKPHPYTLTHGEKLIFSNAYQGLTYNGNGILTHDPVDIVYDIRTPGCFFGYSLEYIFNKLTENCSIKGVKSKFFNINESPIDFFNQSNINYVTGQENRLARLLFSPMSNLVAYLHKGYSGFEYATKSEMSLNIMFETLQTMFDTRWTVDDGYLRIEHVTYFDNLTNTVDLTIEKYEVFINGNLSYRYNNELLPLKEIFTQDNNLTEDYEDVVITYNDSNGLPLNCVGDKEIKREFGKFYTDWNYVKHNPSGLDLNGLFVFTGGYGWQDPNYALYGGDFIWQEVGVKSGVNLLNGHLSNANLVNHYFKSHRSSTFGQIDGIDTSFGGGIKNKESDEFSIIKCCDNEITPNDLIKDNIGTGQITEMTENLKTNELTIKLKY